MNPPTGPHKQPITPLPTRSIILAQILAGAIACGLWILGTLIGGFGADLILPGLLEIGLVIFVTVICTLVITPWTPRPVATWAMILIGSSLVRLILITGLSLLLYSAALMAPKALVISAFLPIATILALETVVIARFLTSLSPVNTTVTDD
ncbi:MAG: hypothetical protein CMJ40_07555 [Phycisphaerae bacterium]|nr:hypothetical protein [Phycisphaerae bacterium]|tara:strand:+ start:3074 stop:3526 length:453 start_codon:yes stop_codon:yes gene_type:complete